MPPTTTLTIAGLGAHPAAVTLTIPDRAVVSGPSQSGKTSILTALCAALLDVGPEGSIVDEQVHDEAGAAEVALALPGCPAIDFRLQRGSRSTLKVDGARSSSAAAHREALGLADLVIARAIMVPFYWHALTRSPRARGLRDLLSAVLPAVDLRAIVGASCDLRDTDPVDLKAALVAQTAANRAASEARGAVQALEGAPAPVAVEPPPPERVTRARAYLARYADWLRYSQDLASWRRQEARRQDAARARAELGPRPDVDEAALTRARNVARDRTADVARARSELDAVRRELDRAQSYVDGDAADARRRLDTARAAPEHCPTCAQPWPAVDLAALEAAARTATEIELAERARRVDPLAARHDAAAAELAQCQAREAYAVEALAEAEREAAAVATWDRRAAALPVLDEVPPPQWDGDELGDKAPAHALAAEELIRTHERAAGATDAAARERAARAARLDEARRRLVSAEAEAERVGALVEALRRAPTEVARRGADALRIALDGSGVELRLAEPGSDADEVRVYVDGRQGWLASTGRLVLADLAIRLAIRRLAAARYPGGLVGYGRLPIVVDRAQDWSGEWPDAPGVWRLVTAPGELRVRLARGVAGVSV